MPYITAKSLIKITVITSFIVLITFLINLIQIFMLTINLRDGYEDWKINKSLEARQKTISDISSDMKGLAGSLDTPMSNLVFLVLGQSKNGDGVSKSLHHFSELIEETAPVIAEVSILETEQSIIGALDRNLPRLVLSASRLKKAISALDSIEWSSVPFLRDQGDTLESEISLIKEVWGDNYRSIGSWSSLLGAREQKRYFVALQNSAQARGTGGMPGTFAIIELNKGKVQVVRTGTNAELRSASRIPIDVPDEFLQIYGNYPANWNPSNLSPHFPYAAKIWLALWQAQTGEKLDGAIAVDPFVLASMLKVSGSIDVYGKPLGPNNTVYELLSNSYKEFEFDNQKRKNFLAEVALIFGKRIETNPPRSLDILRSLLVPLSERRILIYSSDSILQELIEQAAISGSLNYKSRNDYRAIVLNTSGNKMDYYLERNLSIESVDCQPQKTRVTFSLKLDVDPNEKLPDYVNGRKDLGLIGGVGNRHGVAVLIFGPKESSIIAKESDVPRNYLSELGRPVWLKYADLRPGVKQEFNVSFSGGEGPITTATQPLVRPQINSILDLCAP